MSLAAGPGREHDREHTATTRWARAFLLKTRGWFERALSGTTIDRRNRWAGEEVAPGLLRMSAGLEHEDDLWADIATALDDTGTL